MCDGNPTKCPSGSVIIILFFLLKTRWPWFACFWKMTIFLWYWRSEKKFSFTVAGSMPINLIWSKYTKKPEIRWIRCLMLPKFSGDSYDSIPGIFPEVLFKTVPIVRKLSFFVIVSTSPHWVVTERQWRRRRCCYSPARRAASALSLLGRLKDSRAKSRAFVWVTSMARRRRPLKTVMCTVGMAYTFF